MWTIPKPDTGHRTPDTGHRTPDTGHRTPDTGHRTGALSNFHECPTPLQPLGWARITKPDTPRRG
ncbi:hypothetical protein BJN34_0375 (plasmid) [Cupriavidus necator]|uniref:Uncharacterized protein n=1 Tax=Cupriavidus necator TaxID=106590 RepID=A0A2P1DV37_CUPNE|nr:hypothetical protein BJN34_0375 [Cupriavidus necator]